MLKKNFLLFLIAMTFATFNYGQSNCAKEDLVKTWRGCGTFDWDEEADTLLFSTKSLNCREDDCSEHNWMFRQSGSIEFIFTKGCNSGFNSKTKPPKKWLLNQDKCQLKLVSMEGWITYYDILVIDEEYLKLLNRKDLN